MIEIETRQLSGHEIIHAFSAGKGEQPLPTVVFYHGFLSSKLVYSYFAVALAQAGFRVVMPDAPNHGARFTGDEQARLGLFWQTLHGNLTEFAGRAAEGTGFAFAGWPLPVSAVGSSCLLPALAPAWPAALAAAWALPSRPPAT